MDYICDSIVTVGKESVDIQAVKKYCASKTNETMRRVELSKFRLKQEG